MTQSKKKVIAVLCLIVPALILSYFSFKMHESWFYMNPKGVGFWVHYEPDDTSFEKMEKFLNNLKNTGVCPLGKFGALSIFTISLITFIYGCLYLSNPESYKKEMKVMRDLNLSLLVIVFLLSLLMNPYLFVRSIPYFIVQLAIVILLYMII